MKWVIGKRVTESLRFLFKNPVIFLLYLPITLLSLLTYYVSFNTVVSGLFSTLFIILMLVLTSFIFTFIIFKTAYYGMKKTVSFRQNVDLSIKKFKPLLILEAVLVVGMMAFSFIVNLLLLLQTSNFSIALFIVVAVLFFGLLIKIMLALPSCVLQGTLGLRESWKITTLPRFFELLILLAGYLLISYLLSFIPYVGYLAESLILQPMMIIVLTLVYLDYLKK